MSIMNGQLHGRLGDSHHVRRFEVKGWRTFGMGRNIVGVTRPGRYRSGTSSPSSSSSERSSSRSGTGGGGTSLLTFTGEGRGLPDRGEGETGMERGRLAAGRGEDPSSDDKASPSSSTRKGSGTSSSLTAADSLGAALLVSSSTGWSEVANGCGVVDSALVMVSELRARRRTIGREMVRLRAAVGVSSPPLPMRKGFLESPFTAVDNVLLRDGDEKGNKEVFGLFTSEGGGGVPSETARPWTPRGRFGEPVT